ncbi:hypothetical protein E5V15_03240 [Campylobacter jejuni]|nr:hypothetical protein E5V15_03240 [Campylobacter jejuni]
MYCKFKRPYANFYDILKKKYDPIFVFFFQILSCLFLLFISQEHLYQKLQTESIQAFKCFT